MFYFSDNSLPHKPQAQSMILRDYNLISILGIQEKLTPFIKMFKEEFENIQQK